jgi:hypothetical protein
LTAARALAIRVPFHHISLIKTPGVLGRQIAIDNLEQAYREGPVDRLALEMQASSASFRDFENLVVALDALEVWKDIANEGRR